MRARLFLTLCAIGLFLACSGDENAGSSAAPDAASPGADASPTDGGTTADADAPASPVTCEGACKKTSLTAMFGSKTGQLDRAQHGIDHGDTGDTMHVEAHLGGDPACPTATSPTPDRTFIVSGVPRTASAGSTFTQANGAKASFLDFKGDLLANVPLTKSTSMSVTIVAADAANPPAWVALDVAATFAEGTVKGHVYATYCNTLDD